VQVSLWRSLIWQPKMTGGRGISQLEGILRLRFDYARTHKRTYFLSPLGHNCEQGTKLSPDAVIGNWHRIDVENRGGLKGSMQHWLAVYPPEFQIPMFFVAVD
jgi:hypothetical protein